MEHKERNGQIRQKILEEISDIEAFSRERAMDDLKADRMYLKAIVMSLINTEQAVARARTLWHNVNVYVFCDLPVRDAEKID